MLLTVDTPEFEKYLIYDSAGHIIPYVISFDTVTEDIELSIGVHRKAESREEYSILMQIEEDDGQTINVPVIVKFKLPGAYAKKGDELIH